MFRNVYSHIFFYIAPDLGSSFFCDKAPEPTYINIFSLGKGFFHFFEHGF